MHDESIDQQTAAFLDEVRATFEVAAPPPPRPELAALFASGLTSDKGDLSATAASNTHGSAPQTSGLPNWTRRHIDMLNDVMEQVRSKAVAAAAGAVLVLSGLGASGALNAPLRMISDDSAPTEACPAPTDPVTNDGAVADPSPDATDPAAGIDSTEPAAGDTTATGCEAPDDTGTVADGTDGNGTTDGTVAGTTVDLAATTALPAVPTSVSEAAHIHDFDAACGNHGAYVSHVARFGEEPDCATTARGAGTGQGAASGDQTAPATNDAVATDTGDDTQVEGTQAPAPRTHGQGQARHAGKSGHGKSGK